MTGELLNSGINALKDINNVVMRFSEKDENNNHDVTQIQRDLKILTDVLQQAFLDMISVDDMREKISNLEKHLNKFN